MNVKTYQKESQLPLKTIEGSIKAHEKTYIIIDPTGKEITITNLCKFCRENNLNRGDMCQVIKGRKSNYKGWKCKKLERKLITILFFFLRYRRPSYQQASPNGPPTR